jgi:hypothetical protein
MRPPVGFGLTALIRPPSQAMWCGSRCSTKTLICVHDHGLRYSALARQHDLNPLALHRRDLPPQRCFQFADRHLAHPTIRFPKSGSQTDSYCDQAGHRKASKKSAIQAAMQAVRQRCRCGTQYSKGLDLRDRIGDRAQGSLQSWVPVFVLPARDALILLL